MKGLIQIIVSFRKVNFTLGLKEKRKEKRKQECSRFIENNLWILSRVIPTRYVRSHSVVLVHPCVNHDSFSAMLLDLKANPFFS